MKTPLRPPPPAALHISNNVPVKNPYDINLTGQADSFTRDTDGDGLNDASEFQMAALGFNWLVSQPELVNNLFTHANGAGLFTQSQVQRCTSGPRCWQRTRRRQRGDRDARRLSDFHCKKDHGGNPLRLLALHSQTSLR